jgi:GDP-mannose transporter
VLQILSSVIGGWADNAASKTGGLFNVGYFWMTMNCFSSAAFVLFMRTKIKHIQLKDFDTVFYNNLLSIPLLLLASLIMEDWSNLVEKLK